MGSTVSLLLDSGSDEHLCSPKFADLILTGPDRSPLKLKNVQQNDLMISGQKTVPMLVGPTGGKQAMEATATFRVADVRDNILSLGKPGDAMVSSFTLGSSWLLNGERRQERAALLGTNTACVLKHMCCNVRRELDTWRLEQLLWTDDHMKDAQRQTMSCLVECWNQLGSHPAGVPIGTCTCAEHVVNHQRVAFPVA